MTWSHCSNTQWLDQTFQVKPHQQMQSFYLITVQISVYSDTTSTPSCRRSAPRVGFAELRTSRGRQAVRFWLKVGFGGFRHSQSFLEINIPNTLVPTHLQKYKVTIPLLLNPILPLDPSPPPMFPPVHPIDALVRMVNKYNMHSSKVIGNKIKESEPSINKKAASTLRKKLSAIDPSPIDIEQSYLEFSIKNKKDDKKPKETPIKKEAFITPNNKIYNASNTPKLNDSSHHQKPSKPVPTMDFRPKSSNTDKYQKSIQIHSLNHQQVKQQQVRPGSSKSSRLFKKKSSTLVNDDMRSDNDEDDSFIKVTNREKDFISNASMRERQRIGTSLSKKTRGGSDKFQSKLDPEFFNLFAS